VTISPIVAVGALAVALAIGIVAGVYPAGRAARLAPIDALTGGRAPAIRPGADGPGGRCRTRRRGLDRRRS